MGRSKGGTGAAFTVLGNWDVTYQGSRLGIKQGGLVLLAALLLSMADWWQPHEQRTTTCADGSFDFWMDAAGLSGDWIEVLL